LSFINAVDTINEWIAKIISPVLVLIMILAVYEVIRRYVFTNPTTWVWEINSHLMCLLGALAGGYALLHNSHVSVDIVAVRLSKRNRAIVDIITAPFFLIFAGTLIWFGAKEALRAYMVQQRVISQFASLLWPIKSIIPLGAALIFVQGVVKLIRDIRIAAGGQGH